MFAKIPQKTTVLGIATAASVTLTSAIAANPAQALTSYRSEFNVTANALFGGEVATGDFSVTKSELESGKFGYRLTDLNVNLAGETFTLNDILAEPEPFNFVNLALVPTKYQGIFPNMLAGTEYHYIGDGDFLPSNFSYVFSGEAVAQLTSSPQFNQASPRVALLSGVFSQGGQINIKTQSVPEPTALFGIGVMGIGLAATYRRRRNRQIKQQTVA